MVGMLLLLTTAVTAEVDTEILNTSIDYTPYREIVVDEPGVIYQIRIANTGTREKTYDIVPDSEIIKNIGTYRIDPSDKITLKPGEQQTVYFYLAVEKKVTGRVVIPVDVRTGFSETSFELVARPIGPFQEPEQESTSLLIKAFKIVLIIILVIIILIAIIFGFRKIRRKGEEFEEELKPDFEEDIETYY